MLGLDHICVFGQGLDGLADVYQRLGFTLTPRSQHSGSYVAGRPVTLRGTANRCAMLQQGYLELLAVVDPTLDQGGVPEALARHPGIHILAFRTDDADRETARLRAAGVDASRSSLQRQIDGPQGRQVARFAQVRLPTGEYPEARVLALRHETPELLWQAQHLQHPNGAVALQEVLVVVPKLEDAIERYTRLLDVEPRRHGGTACFTLAVGRFVLCDATDGAALQPPVLPFPARITVVVQAIERTAQVLLANGVPFTRDGQRLRVDAAHAAGAQLLFEPQ